MGAGGAYDVAVREHIERTMAGLADDLAHLSFALAKGAPGGDLGMLTLDILDRLANEQVWLREQRLSSPPDGRARVVIDRYRMMVTRTRLLGERFILTLDPADMSAWTDSIVELGAVLDERDAIPG